MYLVYENKYYTSAELSLYLDDLIRERNALRNQVQDLWNKYENQVEKIIVLETKLREYNQKDMSLWQEGYNAGLAKAKQALNEIL